MLKGLGDIGNLMRMQKEMKNIQSKMKKAVMEGSSTDGSVKAMVNGEFQLKEIKVSPDLMKAGDHKHMEKMIISAVNEAVEKVKEFSTAEMAKLTSGMDLPGFLK